MQFIPSEISLGGVYFPPLFLASLLGMSAAAVTALALNRYRLSRFFYYPPVVFLALAVIYTALIGTFVIPA
jgi:hypothetical protein